MKLRQVCAWCPTTIFGINVWSRHFLLLAAAFILHLFNNLAYRFIDSFLPLYAKGEAVDEFGVGIIFCAFSLSVCICSPVWGVVCQKIGYKTIIIIGLTIESLMLLCFPLTTVVSSHYFLVCVTAIRCCQGIGSAATQTGCYALIAAESGGGGDGAGQGMGGLEMFGGVGNMAGPLIGGALYSTFGYSTPSLSVGCTGIVFLYTVAVLLPSRQQLTDEVDAAFINKYTHGLTHGLPSASSFTAIKSSRSLSSLSLSVRAYVGESAQSEAAALAEQKVSLTQVLTVPSVIYCCLVAIIALASMSFLDPTLEAAFESSHHMNEIQVGGCFALLSFLQLLCCPLAGYIADRYATKLPMFVGLLCICAALCCLGPSPLLGFIPAELPIQLVALALLGFGVSLAVIPTFVDQIKSAAHLGVGSQPLIAGLSASVFSAGEVIGPLLGSTIVQMLGFPWCCSIWAMACLATALIGMLLALLRIIPYNAHTLIPSSPTHPVEKKKKNKQQQIAFNKKHRGSTSIPKETDIRGKNSPSHSPQTLPRLPLLSKGSSSSSLSIATGGNGRGEREGGGGTVGSLETVAGMDEITGGDFAISPRDSMSHLDLNVDPDEEQQQENSSNNNSRREDSEQRGYEPIDKRYEPSEHSQSYPYQYQSFQQQPQPQQQQQQLRHPLQSSSIYPPISNHPSTTTNTSSYASMDT